MTATEGATVLVSDSAQGVMQLDSSGQVVGAPAAAIAGMTPFRLGIPVYVSQSGTVVDEWTGDSNSMATALAGVDAIGASSVYPDPSGEGQLSRASVPTATITVHYRPGSRSAGDKLQFPTTQIHIPDEPAETCSQDLGLLDCTDIGKWPWNVEIAATVSDDASKWAPKQKAAYLATGYYKVLGTLYAYGSYLNKDPDEIFSVNLQNPSNQKAVFYIDSPGPWFWADHAFDGLGDEEPFDSLYSVYNIRSGICNWANKCAVVKWHFDVVVDTGAVLNRSQSLAGFGYVPF